MKHAFASIPLIALLAAAGTSGVLAHEESSNFGPYHWFSHLQQGSAEPPAPMASTTFDPAQYAEGASLYLIHNQIAAMSSLPGMAGPLRTDSEMEATEREWDRRLGSVNGRDTP